MMTIVANRRDGPPAWTIVGNEDQPATSLRENHVNRNGEKMGEYV